MKYSKCWTRDCMTSNADSYVELEFSDDLLVV